MTESIAVRIGSPPSIEVTMVAVGKALAIDCIKPLLTPLLMPVAVPVVEVCLMVEEERAAQVLHSRGHCRSYRDICLFLCAMAEVRYRNKNDGDDDGCDDDDD